MYPGLDFFAKDTQSGDTAFHVACRNQNKELVKKIFAIRPEKCLAPNFKG
jgi:ankyrin repeat protein